jgi:hypothetical protein
LVFSVSLPVTDDVASSWKLPTVRLAEEKPMNANSSYFASHGLNHVGRAGWAMVVTGGLAIAAADLIYCVLFWSTRGVSPMRILQGVAAGALGPPSFHGGIATALLGASIQWLIGACYVLAYAIAARRVTLLRLHPRRYGIAYGMLLYLVMNNIVVPLSSAPQPAHPNLTWMLANIPMFGLFGTIAALYAQRAIRSA